MLPKSQVSGVWGSEWQCERWWGIQEGPVRDTCDGCHFWEIGYSWGSKLVLQRKLSQRKEMDPFPTLTCPTKCSLPLSAETLYTTRSSSEPCQSMPCSELSNPSVLLCCQPRVFCFNSKRWISISNKEEKKRKVSHKKKAPYTWDSKKSMEKIYIV